MEGNTKEAGTPANLPAERNDEIGALARQLIGSDDGVPDFTAAVPLFDALMFEKDFHTAFRLRSELANMVPLLMGSVDQDPRQRVRVVREMRNGLIGCLTGVLFDYGSLAGELAALVERCVKKEEVKSSRTEVETMRVSVPPHARRGMNVPIDDSRMGTVVSDRGPDGKADVVPMDEEQYAYAEDGSGPMSGMASLLGGAMGPPRPMRAMMNPNSIPMPKRARKK